MDSFIVDTDFRLADLRALEVAVRLKVARNAGAARRMATRLAALGFALIFAGGLAFMPGSNGEVAWALGALSMLLFVVSLAWIVRRSRRPLPNGIFIGKAHFEFDTDGIRVQRRLSEGSMRWAQVLGIDVTATHLFLWIDTATGYVIPARDLPAPMTAESAAQRLRDFIAAAPRDADIDIRAGVTSTVPVHSTVPAPIPEAKVAAWRELLAVARALALRRFDTAQVAGRDASIFLLGGILLALWIPLDPLVYSDELEVDWYSVPGLAWVIGGTFALAWLLARLTRPRVEYGRVLLLTLGALPLAMLGSVAFGLLPETWFFPLIALFGAWAVLYFERVLRWLSGGFQWRALTAGALATGLFVWAGSLLSVSPSPWVYAQDSEEQSGDTEDDDAVWARMSALQFGQQARIDAEVARIASHATAQPEVFFLGLAGNGRQRLFAEEIALAAKVVGTRYHASDRELLLVNDARDLERRPLATPEALRHSLRALGRIMDPDDVLFIALSSHGGEDATIEIANAGMAPMSLGAEELAAMLRDAKIPRKVIVISACYAGAFVPVLADEHTTVITAAAADRTSFGCADDRDLTYFGEAFYRDALPGARTLQDAFERARHDIAEREREERIEPSLPQASFAPDVQSRLEPE
jgi:hypothetical protein